MKWSQMGGLRVEAEKKTFERGAYLHKYKNYWLCKAVRTVKINLIF